MNLLISCWIVTIHIHVGPDYAMEQLNSANYFITFMLSSSTSSLWLKYLSCLCMKIKFDKVWQTTQCTPDFCFPRGNKSSFSKHLDPETTSFTYSAAWSLKLVLSPEFFWKRKILDVTKVTKGLTLRRLILLLVWNREYLEHK